MLNYRRVIEFSSRVHTYLLSLYVFFSLLFLLSVYLPVSASFFGMICTTLSVLSWTMVLEGAWIVLASIHITIIGRVVCFKPVLLTVLRLLMMAVVSALLDMLRMVIVDGLSIGV